VHFDVFLQPRVILKQGSDLAAPVKLDGRQRRKLALRARILEVARELFATRGFRTTTVAEICNSTDIANKTFFNHFPSKQDLLRELAQESLEGLFGLIDQVRAEEPTLRGRLRLLLSRLAERMAEAGPMHRETVTENIHILNESSEKSEHARRLTEAFGAIVRDGLEAGEVTRGHDAQTLTEMILGAYYVLMFNYANLDDFPIRAQAAAVADFLADALARSPEE